MGSRRSPDTGRQHHPQSDPAAAGGPGSRPSARSRHSRRRRGFPESSPTRTVGSAIRPPCKSPKRDTGANRVETLPLASGRGFARLARPDPGDIFFDIEGARFVEDGSLEYLFGLVALDYGVPRYTAFWAHDRQAEKRAFEDAMDFIAARLDARPNAHVYHYASYEETALKRLAMVHGTQEARLDDLLRRRKLVDLCKVVREGVRISEPSYSLKNLEVFYGGERAGAVTTARDSMVVYDRWQQTGDAALLDEIRVYNEADCRSLLSCRDWLLSLRPSGLPWFEEAAILEPGAARNEERKESEKRNAALVAALLAGAPEADRPWRELAGQLVDFHKRGGPSPTWWRCCRSPGTERGRVHRRRRVHRRTANRSRAPARPGSALNHLLVPVSGPGFQASPRRSSADRRDP